MLASMPGPTAFHRGHQGRSKLRTWLRATRPLAQANLAPPLVLGCALACAGGTPWSWTGLAFALVWGWVAQCMIVFVNDANDADIDGLNTTPTAFSGGSRVVVDGSLSRLQLERGALLATFVLIALSCLAAWLWRQPVLLLCALLTYAASRCYSAPPFQLSRREGGEWLQALGMGLVLPLAGHAAQGGMLSQFPLAACIPAVMLGYAGHICTALPDLRADAKVGKRSIAVRLGSSRARAMVVACLAFAATSALWLMPWSEMEHGIWALATAAAYAAIVVCAFWHRRQRSKNPGPQARALAFILGCGFVQQGLYLTWIVLLLV